MNIPTDLPITPFLKSDVPCAIWRRSTRRRRAIKPRRLLELNVLIGVSGRARYFINGRLFELGARSVLIAESGDWHFLVSETQDTDMIVAAVSTELLANVPVFPDQNSNLQRAPRQFSSPAFDEILQISDLLIDATDKEVLKLGMSWWLYRLWANWADADTQVVPLLHPGVAKALSVIQDTPSLSISDVARLSGVSSDYLGYVFRKQTGQTLSQYRTGQRLKTVERLVREEPNTTLLNAALDAGFKDYSSFYRSYQKVHGQSPKSLKGLP